MLIQQKLGERIQVLRRETGLSQEKFALHINMDRTYFAGSFSNQVGKQTTISMKI